MSIFITLKILGVFLLNNAFNGVCFGGEKSTTILALLGVFGQSFEGWVPWGGGLLRGSWGANPPPPLGPVANSSLPKLSPLGVHGRQRRPILHEHQRCPKEKFLHFAPQHYPCPTLTLTPTPHPQPTPNPKPDLNLNPSPNPSPGPHPRLGSE